MTILQSPGTLHIQLPMREIIAPCEKYAVEELSLYGSILGNDFRPDSDVDILVVFKDNNYGPWMSKLGDMENELSALLQRKVDLVPKPAIEQSRNWIRRKHILQSAKVIYES